jgi:hypothetical protein
MCDILKVRWTITPKTAPQPWLACSTCGTQRAFQSSDKVRLNANGRRLDAWLIYKCLICDKTWNRPLFERRNVRDIDPQVLEALEANDAAWIRAESFNLDALRRKAQRIDEFPDVEIAKQVLEETAGWTRLAIELIVPLAVATRLDRLLSGEFQLSRTRLQALHETGLLHTLPERADMLRRRVSSGIDVIVDLATVSDRERVWKPLATGSPL